MASKPQSISKFERSKEQEVPHDERIMSFFCPSTVGGAIRASDWDVAEEIERLTSIARGDSEKNAMQAMKQIREIVREVAELNGMITATTASITNADESGTRTITKSANRLVSNLKGAPNAISEDSTDRIAAVYLPSRGSSPGGS